MCHQPVALLERKRYAIQHKVWSNTVGIAIIPEAPMVETLFSLPHHGSGVAYDLSYFICEA